MEVFKRDAFAHQKFQSKGIVPFKLGHVAFHVTDVKNVTNSIATCSAFANPTGWATSSRSCAAGPTTTPST